LLGRATAARYSGANVNLTFACYFIYFQPHIQRLVVLARCVLGKHLVNITTENPIPIWHVLRSLLGWGSGVSSSKHVFHKTEDPALISTTGNTVLVWRILHL